MKLERHSRLVEIAAMKERARRQHHTWEHRKGRRTKAIWTSKESGSQTEQERGQWGGSERGTSSTVGLGWTSDESSGLVWTEMTEGSGWHAVAGGMTSAGTCVKAEGTCLIGLKEAAEGTPWMLVDGHFGGPC